ncbi:cellulose biosynthesis cyclic di-GMP-binding regulatory protein BcsB [Rhizobium sp. TRM95111]|uniref:cellulose biosynthesis cyclic di-GMP-binding regulatory protein BcsB n=1 Tax=Rhizobium alarense TaxID=2846851 RepID=UPI001F1BBD3A|nr:cellulose biosynthesis cyclic di-GMP-binding regulatory protein BcsB [Rhizobium alarense]MCF3642953.1 cellulose biosynthesis cyclic di-GMP-binding regulatory protein BcsB [Rhizobium alarense]
MAKLLPPVTALPLVLLLVQAAAAQSLLPEAAVTPDSGLVQSTLLPETADRKEAAPAASVLVPFEQSAGRLVLTGEDDLAVLTVHLSDVQARVGGRLQLAYENAVSVLPDTAMLDVEVNGREAGSVPIRSPGGSLDAGIPVAADMLIPGRNVIRLRARQHHRVDCALDATYELWTRLDPARSGLVTSRPTTFTDFDSLLSVAHAGSGRTELRLVLPGPLSAEAFNEAAPVLQALTVFLDRDDLSVSLGDRPGDGPGIDLIVAMDRDGGRLLADIGMADAPRGLSVRDGVRPGRATVVLRAANLAEVNAAVLSAVRGAMRDGLAEGALAPKHGMIVAEAGKRYTLKDAGYETRVFAGRLSRTSFDLDMPADFYPAEYATVDLLLHAATSPGLKQTAQVLVRVNDRVVKSYPLRNREGEQLEGRKIELPLRAFRPGVNRVELLAELPTAADDTCLPEERRDDRPRFILLDRTVLVVPNLARIARLPELAAFAGRSYPFADGRPFDVAIDRADARTAEAALQMLARLAFTARAPLNARFTIGMPKGGSDRHALLVSTENRFAELGAAKKQGFPPADAAEAAFASGIVDPLTTAAVSDAAVSGDNDAEALLSAFRTSTAVDDEERSISSRLNLVGAAAVDRFARWLSYSDGSDAAPARRKDEPVVSLTQRLSPDGATTWTVLSAESPADLQRAVGKLTEPGVWRGLHGGTATVETASLAVGYEAAARHTIAAVTDRSPGNLRRLAAAWLSDNFQIYVLLVLGLLGGFAVWLGRVVPRSGVRTDR